MKMKVNEMSDTKPNQGSNLLNPRQSMKTEPHSLCQLATINTYLPTSVMDSKDQVCKALQDLEKKNLVLKNNSRTCLIWSSPSLMPLRT